MEQPQSVQFLPKNVADEMRIVNFIIYLQIQKKYKCLVTEHSKYKKHIADGMRIVNTKKKKMGGQ